MSALFVISDATGETGERVLRSALAQFPAAEFEIVRHGGVRSVERVREVVAEARAHGAWILHTLVSNSLRGEMLAECRRQGVDAMDLMGPVLDRLTVLLRSRPQEKPGLFQQLREARTRSIEAVEFAFRHDDGQRIDAIGRAELVLVGVSRTMKTPVSLYLAYRGWFVANVPIVPPLPVPAGLDEVSPSRVFALTMRPSRLMEIRHARAQHLRMPGTAYTELPSIRDELHRAEQITRDRGWHLVDVTAKSVEEVAREILDLHALGEAATTRED